MRFPSTLSDTRLSFSFFLTTPAKKPRTECCCQSVAFMIAAIVVPFGSPNIFSTTDCFDDGADDDFDAAAVAAGEVTPGWVGGLRLAERLFAGGNLRADFAAFG